MPDVLGMSVSRPAEKIQIAKLALISVSKACVLTYGKLEEVFS